MVHNLNLADNYDRYGLPEQVRGRPLLAKGDLADKILNDLHGRSVAFGTAIENRGGVGYVKIK